jgi:L-amino acid N-acyltransferase YncA
MEIRAASQQDYDAIWEIFSNVIQTGDTYVFDPNTPKSDLEKNWLAPSMHTFVMADGEKILGTYFLKPNQIDLGNHIANCGYMVHPDAQGKGVGKLLCQHSIETATKLGYLAIQFNIVVSTNVAAVKLWQKNGFSIIGTTPNGFRHQQLGLVDTYMMYRAL